MRRILYVINIIFCRFAGNVEIGDMMLIASDGDNKLVPAVVTNIEHKYMLGKQPIRFYE